jgi:hypothetical protein
LVKARTDWLRLLNDQCAMLAQKCICIGRSKRTQCCLSKTVGRADPTRRDMETGEAQNRYMAIKRSACINAQHTFEDVIEAHGCVRWRARHFASACGGTARRLPRRNAAANRMLVRTHRTKTDHRSTAGAINRRSSQNEN